MRRKIAWLALLLVLGALMLGVKWRAEHPAPTTEDLRIRKQLSLFTTVKLTHSRTVNQRGVMKFLASELTGKEFEQFIPSFHLSRGVEMAPYGISEPTVTLDIDFYKANARKNNEPSLAVKIDLQSKGGIIDSGGSVQNLHPVTVKRWLQLLKSHPGIAPEFSKRMRQ